MSVPVTGTEAEQLDRRLGVMIEGIHASGTGRLKHFARKRDQYASIYPPLVFDEAECTLHGRKTA